MSTLPWGPIKKERIKNIATNFQWQLNISNWTLERITMATILQLIKKASQSIYNQLYLPINQNLLAGFKDFNFSFPFSIFLQIERVSQSSLHFNWSVAYNFMWAALYSPLSLTFTQPFSDRNFKSSKLVIKPMTLKSLKKHLFTNSCVEVHWHFFFNLA